MTAAERPGWALTFGYDALGRLTSETGPLGTIASTYRIDGARERITYPDGEYFDTSYWDNGAPLALYEGDDSNDRLGLWTYDVEQRLERYYAGASTGRSIQYFDYDPVSRLSEIEHNIPIVADRVTIGLSGYNPAGQIVTRTRSNAAYAFDAPQTGTTGYTVNGLNQYSTVNPPGSETTSETYDARGNLTDYNSSIAADDRTYSYDALNRLRSARVDGASTATNLFYDPLGRLSAVTTPGGSGRRYLWDGDRIIAQYAGSTLTVQRRFVHAPGSLGAPVTEYVGAAVDLASRRYLQTDERGSVISVVHADNGATAEINTYGPYGENGAGNGGQFQYTGQLWLPEAELYYMRNRAYDPALGRFAQTDPIGYAGGMNLYAYVGNDPTNFVDPWGLQGCQSGFRFDSALSKCVRIDAGPPSPPPGDVVHPPIVVCGNCVPIPPAPPPPDLSSFNDAVRNSGFQGAGFSDLLDGAGNVPQSLERNGPKPPSHDDNDPDYNRDLNQCRALDDPGARARCYDSAERRRHARDNGVPEVALPPLILWRVQPLPIPSPRCLRLRHPLAILGCEIITN